jgi:hypothetical protein
VLASRWDEEESKATEVINDNDDSDPEALLYPSATPTQSDAEDVQSRVSSRIRQIKRTLSTSVSWMIFPLCYGISNKGDEYQLHMEKFYEAPKKPYLWYILPMLMCQLWKWQSDQNEIKSL